MQQPPVQNYHIYPVRLLWTGNNPTLQGQGTSSYTSYERSYEVQVEGKPILLGSSDVAYRGDATKYNPEEMLVAAISACHMLWYLHLCADNSITVHSYEDKAIGYMQAETRQTGKDGSSQVIAGKFTQVLLRPLILLKDPADQQRATELHHAAHQRCFIANSVNFEVLANPGFSFPNGGKLVP